MSQRHYIQAMLAKFRMDECNPVATPLPQGFEALPATDSDAIEAQDFPYRELVGSILYASIITRPDLAHAAGTLCRFMSKWNNKHIAAAKHCLRYIKGTAQLALTFKRNHKDNAAANSVPNVSNSIAFSAMGFTDADWANDKVTRRSNTGFLFKCFGGPVAWKSRLQPTVALSTTEAEYMATADAVRHAIWIKRLLEDLGFPLGNAQFPILNDNRGCIALARNPVFHERTKHIDIKHHFLREKVIDNTVSLDHIASKDNTADLFTKYLPRDRFQELRGLIGLETLAN